MAKLRTLGVTSYLDRGRARCPNVTQILLPERSFVISARRTEEIIHTRLARTSRSSRRPPNSATYHFVIDKIIQRVLTQLAAGCRVDARAYCPVTEDDKPPES